MKGPFMHPYIPNSVPEVAEALMREIGVLDMDELFEDLPVRSRPFALPGPMSEYELWRHIHDILKKNHDQLLIFCGAGCWPHYVPAVVDEIVNRTEFKTAYLGLPEPEKGKMQALFEYQSLMAELIGMDVVINSVYDWASAAGEAANMARRLTRRPGILVPANVSPDRLDVIRTYTEWSGARVETVAFDPGSGTLDLSDLETRLGPHTAALYVENPSYLGVIEDQGDILARMAHEAGALFVVGVDASSLGVLKAPGDYGADVVVGEAQPLGLHMNFGGNFLGIFGCRDQPEYLEELPGYVGAVAPTVDGQGRGYLDTLWDRRHFFHMRENATSMIGSASNLCAIAVAVYLSLLGPKGMQELGETICAKAHYAIQRLGRIPGLRVPLFQGAHFKEFGVNFDGWGGRVAEINRVLWQEFGIVGGKNLSGEYPALGQSALFCVTEAHTLQDIEALGAALEALSERRWR